MNNHLCLLLLLLLSLPPLPPLLSLSSHLYVLFAIYWYISERVSFPTIVHSEKSEEKNTLRIRIHIRIHTHTTHVYAWLKCVITVKLM